MKDLDLKVISVMRGLAIDAINEAKGGHMGMAIGVAPITYSLYAKTLNINLKDPKWINRDRFVLSAGHGSMSIYSIMNLLGILNIEDLKKHKTFGSKTPSHPEIDAFPFIDASTGPLGQGIAMSVGMAISQKYLASKFNKDKFPIFDHYIFALHGDGCIQEGVSAEALQLAGTMQLDKLIIIHDYNNAQIDTKAEEVNNIDLLKYFESFNFATFDVNKPTVENILEAIKQAKLSKKPSYIRVHTIIAEHTKKAGTPKGHNGTLSPEETIEFKKEINLKTFTPFVYEKEIYEYVQKHWEEKNKIYDKWQKMFANYAKEYPKEYEQIKLLFENKLRFSFDKVKFDLKNCPTRDYFEQYIKFIEQRYWNVIGGSADLYSATKVGFSKSIKNGGQGINYGIREFAMTAINNGIYLDSNLRTIDSTFLSFADYAKGALRLGSMMHIPAIHFYTHDSYLIGGDGPTHQPFDQMPMLRSMSNLKVYRPSTKEETKYVFENAFNDLSNQSVIIGTRQPIVVDEELKFNNREGYSIYSKSKDFDLSILTTGSEVDLAIQVAKNLWERKKIKIQVISIPLLQDFANNERLIKYLKINTKPIFAIEASSDNLWYKFAKYNKLYTHLALTYGYSADGEIVYNKKGFNVKNISIKIIEFLKKINNRGIENKYERNSL